VPRPGDDEKAERRAAQETVAAYHKEQLRGLLERVRSGFEQLDAGEIDEFELDDLIYHYKRSAAELWKFCDYTGSRALQRAHAITRFREEGSDPDWWEAGTPRRERSP
jgi:hypothetical protein